MDNPNKPAANGAKVYEMQWDCKFCGTKKLLGKTHRFCPNCGAQQDPSWRYFPSDTEKVAVQDHVYVGADIVCKACQSLNSGKAEFCGNCGSPLNDSARAKDGASRSKDDGQSFETEDLKQRQQATALPQLAVNKPVPKKSGGINKWVIIGLIILLGIGGAIFALTRTKNASAYVTGYKWERSVGIDVMEAVPGKSECNREPLGAYNITQRYEQVGSQQVPDGETCHTKQVDQGDGTFREEQQCETNYRSEPVMGYMCYYVVNQWVSSNPVVASGDKSTAPYWPDTNLGANAGCLLPGCRREGGRNETYVLTFKGDGDRAFECPVAYDLWQNTPLEKGFNIKVGSLLKDFRCDTLKPAE